MSIVKKYLRYFEDLLLCLLLGAMLSLSLVQIILRFLDRGLYWIDPLLRLLVLWAGLMGAVVACREKQHIAIDLFSRFVADRHNRLLQIILSLFSGGICLLLAWLSIRFVQDEARFGGRMLLLMPSWMQNSIFPLAFLLMGLHFLLQAGESFRSMQASNQELREDQKHGSRAVRRQ